MDASTSPGKSGPGDSGSGESFRYFAYGSNLYEPRMRSRCPSARLVGLGRLSDFCLVYDKPSKDGSAKLNLRAVLGETVLGVIYEIALSERPGLDGFEGGYTPIQVSVQRGEQPVDALTYQYVGAPSNRGPFEWYVALVVKGAREHGLPEAYIRSELERS